MRASAKLAAFAALLFVSAAVFEAPAQEALPRDSGREQSGFDNATAGLVSRQDDHLTELAGRPVLGVSVETTGRRWQRKPQLGSVPIGEPLTAELARRALRELLDTGGFAQAYVDARAYQEGVILRVVAVPRRIVAQLAIESGALPATKVKSVLGIAVGSEVTEPILRQVRSRVIELYRRRGFHHARVTLTTADTDDPMKVLVRLDVDAGEARRISRRIFVIEPRYQRILANLEESYRSGQGDVADEDDLAEADDAMAEQLRRHDFLQATVVHRVVKNGPHAFLYVYLQSGPQYRFRFERARAFDPSELVAALELQKAEPSPAALADRLAGFYQKRGYLDARVVTRQDELQAGAVRLITFELFEGDKIGVAERRYPCLPADAPAGLGKKDLDDAIDALIEQELPSAPILGEIDDHLADEQLSPGGGRRAPARHLEPAQVYQAEAYQHALDRLKQLLSSKGYLNAIVGPVTVIRARCDPHSASQCLPLPLPEVPAAACKSDALDMPLPEAELPAGLRCTPDPRRSLRCAPTLTLSIPIHLGPVTRLYDVAFEGNKSFAPAELLGRSGLSLGAPLSQLDLDAARTRIQNAYADGGYAYATVRVDLDQSPDRTRARARFTIVEHEPVVITGYEVRGAVRTDPELILRRLALCRELAKCSEKDRYFRRDLVRQSEQQIATLGTFSSVSVTLEDPDIPQKQKRVIISVVEQATQYLEPRVGFSTGEGFRFALEYGHRNVAGEAIALTLRIELGYLPDFVIIDPQVRDTYATFLSSLSDRLTRRDVISVRFPDIGLGPKVTLNLDGVDVRANYPQFGLTREALLPVLTYQPLRNVTLQLGSSLELNDVTIFQNGSTIADIINQNPALATLLREPAGRTLAVSQSVSATWDRRDNPLAATRGTLLSAAVAHVSAFPLNADTQFKSEFLRLNGRGAGYLRLTDKGLAIALSMAAGYNLQLASYSATYPDRLFFMGGFGTMRGWFLDEMVPEDIARQIQAGKITIDQVGVRGGNFFLNPRAELRIPLNDTFSFALFLDTGNVWSQISSIQSAADLFTFRYSPGAGIRASTPVGPMALDGGFVINRRDWEDIGGIAFSIGLF